jgi:hypothetical protein
MFAIDVNPEILTIIATGLLAVIFDWSPVLAAWYDKLSRIKKKQVMAALLIAVVLCIHAATCYGIFQTGLACGKSGFAELIYSMLVAIGVNQGTHLLLKPVK